MRIFARGAWPGNWLAFQSHDTAAAVADRVVAMDAGRFAAESGPREVAFVAIDLETGLRHALNTHLVRERHAPCATFHIPHLLVALETGVAASLDHRMAWDVRRRPRASHWPDDWARPQSLRRAFTRSVAWYFQDLAADIGAKTLRDWLRRLGYGNARTGRNNDAFWLDGTLQVSVLEQADFMRRLLSRELDVSLRTLDALEEVMLLERYGRHTLHAKTGSGPVRARRLDGAFQGWLVGYVRRPDLSPVVFALHVTGPDYAAIRHFRREMAERLLRDIGALPPL